MARRHVGLRAAAAADDALIGRAIDPAPAISRTGDGVEGPSRPEGAAKGETPCAALLGRFPAITPMPRGSGEAYTGVRTASVVTARLVGTGARKQPRGFLHF